MTPLYPPPQPQPFFDRGEKLEAQKLVGLYDIMFS